MITQKLKLMQIAVATFRRVWLVFSFVLVLGVSAFSVVLGDNPLSSDDPHLFGFLFGFVAVGFALLYSVVDYFKPSMRLKRWIVAIVLVVWCLFNALGEAFVEANAKGLPMFIAVGSLVAGAIAWRLCISPPPTWICVLVSLAGLASVLVYGYVVMRMNAIN